MKYVLMSGSYKGLVIYDEIVKFVHEYIDKTKSTISFVSANFDSFDENDHYVDKLIKCFNIENIFFDNVTVIDNRMTSIDMMTAMKESNILFILGGDTLAQIKNINKYGLKELFSDKSKLIIGMSAGAINMAKRVVLAKDVADNIPELTIYDGLGITDINIEPHCDFKDTEHWRELERASFYAEIVVMNDDSYIIVDGDKISFYGSYLRLKNGTIIYKN